MNFILFHIGDTLPPHLPICVKQIQKTNPDAQIYILTNLPIAVDVLNIHIVPIDTIPVPDIGNYYRYDPMGYLFRSAMFRIFFLQRFMQIKGIEEAVHFDNDVLIYANVNQIQEELRKHDILMTSHNEKDYVFGFSYFKNCDKFQILVNQLHEFVVQGEKPLEQLLGSMPHEMRLLNYVNTINNKKLIDLLPIFPFSECFPKYGYCFDPSSYGQFLGGRAPETTHYIGRELIAKTIQVNFIDKQPRILYSGQEYKLFNLHVHNKKLEEFV